MKQAKAKMKNNEENAIELAQNQRSL